MFINDNAKISNIAKTKSSILHGPHPGPVGSGQHHLPKLPGNAGAPAS